MEEALSFRHTSSTIWAEFLGLLMLGERSLIRNPHLPAALSVAQFLSPSSF